MFEGKFCFYVFHCFVNQTNGKMVNPPMGMTHAQLVSQLICVQLVLLN